MKVVINRCFGGFSLSRKALRLWCEKKGRKCFFFKNVWSTDGRVDFYRYIPITDDGEEPSIWYAFDVPEIPDEPDDGFWERHNIYGRDIARDDKDLVAVVEELRDKASGSHAELAVVEIPDGIEWEISEYDGKEHVVEKHRTWR